MAEIELREVDTISEELLKEIIGKILEVIDPEKIILFGSYAYGSPSSKSDLDLLVVVKRSELPRYKRSVPIYQALAGILIPKDILVYTEEEIDEWTEVPQAFVTTVVRKGKVVYEKDKARYR